MSKPFEPVTETSRKKHRIITISEVEHRVSKGKSWIYQNVKNGQFPQPIKVGVAQTTGWIESEIDQWIEEQIAASRAVG